MIDINKIGQEVAALIKGAEKDKEKIAPMLRKVWSALEAKEEVNGAKSKGAWAKKFGITLRYCQYIVKDGSRKRTEKKDANRVRSGFLGRIAEAKRKVGDIQRAWDAPYKDGEIRNFKDFGLEQISPILEAVHREFENLLAPDGYEVMRTGNGNWVVQARGLSESELEQPTKTSKPVDPAKELIKRFRMVKRTAKFYNGMMKELRGVDWRGATSQKYDKLREQYPPDSPYGDSQYPWTPPKGYTLPKTLKEFETEYTTAFAELDEVMAEGKEKGILTDAPPAPKKKKVKRYSTNVHPGFMTMPGKPHKTHKMQPDGKRTWCGKTPGETLAADARMVDDPTCRGCRTGEHTDKLRRESAQPKVTEMHPAAEALAETVGATEELTWGQKVCIPGSPEREKWSADLQQRRELEQEIALCEEDECEDEEEESEENN